MDHPEEARAEPGPLQKGSPGSAAPDHDAGDRDSHGSGEGSEVERPWEVAATRLLPQTVRLALRVRIRSEEWLAIAKAIEQSGA